MLFLGTKLEGVEGVVPSRKVDQPFVENDFE
jgi:hypothetical protein